MTHNHLAAGAVERGALKAARRRSLLAAVRGRSRDVVISTLPTEGRARFDGSRDLAPNEAVIVLLD